MGSDGIVPAKLGLLNMTLRDIRRDKKKGLDVRYISSIVFGKDGIVPEISVSYI